MSGIGRFCRLPDTMKNVLKPAWLSQKKRSAYLYMVCTVH